VWDGHEPGRVASAGGRALGKNESKDGYTLRDAEITLRMGKGGKERKTEPSPIGSIPKENAEGLLKKRTSGVKQIRASQVQRSSKAGTIVKKGGDRKNRDGDRGRTTVAELRGRACSHTMKGNKSLAT